MANSLKLYEMHSFSPPLTFINALPTAMLNPDVPDYYITL